MQITNLRMKAKMNTLSVLPFCVLTISILFAGVEKSKLINSKVNLLREAKINTIAQHEMFQQFELIQENSFDKIKKTISNDKQTIVVFITKSLQLRLSILKSCRFKNKVKDFYSGRRFHFQLSNFIIENKIVSISKTLSHVIIINCAKLEKFQI